MYLRIIRNHKSSKNNSYNSNNNNSQEHIWMDLHRHRLFMFLRIRKCDRDNSVRKESLMCQDCNKHNSLILLMSLILIIQVTTIIVM